MGSLLGLRSRIIAAAAIGTVDDALCADLGEFDRDHPETATAVVAGVLSIVDTSLDELVERSGMAARIREEVLSVDPLDRARSLREAASLRMAGLDGEASASLLSGVDAEVLAAATYLSLDSLADPDLFLRTWATMPPGPMRDRVGEMFASGGPAATEALCARISQFPYPDAVALMRWCDPSPSAPAVLADLVEHPSPGVRAAAAAAWARHLPAATPQAVVTALSDPSEKVRAAAAAAAGAIGLPGRRMARLLDDESWDVRMAAAAAMAETMSGAEGLADAAGPESPPRVASAAVYGLALAAEGALLSAQTSTDADTRHRGRTVTARMAAISEVAARAEALVGDGGRVDV